VRFVLIIGVGFAILYPTLLHFERKSPLHLVVKPAAERRVRASAVAEGLLGDQISFGSEKSFNYNIGGQTGSGEFLCSVRGSKGSGDLDVTAKETDSVWHLDSITLVMNDKSVPIPIE
jgi:hypothetical protein